MSRRSALMSLAAASAVVVVGILAGCAPEAPVPTATPTPTESVTITPSGDGVLRFGTLLPSSGELAALGPAQVAAVEVAVREINAAGGVLGKPVEVLHRDSGAATADRIDGSMADLVARGVDVIVGPSSTALVERIMPVAIDATIAVVSTTMSSRDVPVVDGSGFLFRTSPEYASQGDALGRILPESGASKVALVYTGDAAGESLKTSLDSSLENHDGSLVASEALAASTRVSAVVTTMSNAEPDAVVVAIAAANRDQTTALITALTKAGLGGTKLWLTSENLTDYSSGLTSGVLDGANGIRGGAATEDSFVARLAQADPAVSDTRLAAEAYDATIAAALAAVFVADDSGRSVSLGLPPATSGGITCRSFGECLDVLRTETDIDYDGISGLLDVSSTGHASGARFGIYRYDADNSYSRASTWDWK